MGEGCVPLSDKSIRKMTAKCDEAQYAKVLGEYKPRPIHGEKENQRAIDAVEHLDATENPSPEEEALAELLTTLIEKFEEERYALNAASPSEILQELLEANGLKQKDLAKLVGSKGIASEILNGKRRISRALARLFADRFHVPYRLFI
ncbi:MAG: HTH-type transcriptional regulator / antitoxin HigA [Candidatus Eremiobacteraeota bacterium]|jgi:HTH-type transcriptional regulator/antitoxin HigA|nr:HTH-type transcriptional regulator / antitoxin HigA [Candidatus Eremiobacteraeota bacterium]